MRAAWTESALARQMLQDRSCIFAYTGVDQRKKEFPQLLLEVEIMSTSPKEPVQNAVLPTNGRAEPLVDVHSPNHRIAVWENVEKLRGYAANWDGYGAPPFTNEMLEAVKTFLTHLPEDLLLYPFMEADCLLPAVVPMSDGAIQLEWHVGSRVLELEFETPSTIHYLKWWPQESIEEEEMYPAEDWGQSTRLIEWVLHGHDPE